MKKITLSKQDREFFRLVSEASSTNPFSEARFAIDKQIAGAMNVTEWRQLIPKVVEAIGQRLDRLDPQHHYRFQDFAGDDAGLMRYTYLFDVYHRHSLAFDDFIMAQRQSTEPHKVPFANTVIRELVHRGFSEEAAVHLFSIFYQIRRTFYFIHHGLVGKSACMRKLRMDLWNNIFTSDIRDYEKGLWDRMEDFSTLLEGATGSGKGAAAAAIGRSGFIPFDVNTGKFVTSFTRTFLPINLSQYAESLLESELFGHTKGAFTGAVSEHQGIFSLCDKHGAIFLDEIGEVSLPVQVKLLKVLEERTFTSVGSHDSRRFEGRVIAATNRPVAALRAEGKFRDDFYYRLCSDCIHVPSLAERIAENENELAELVGHFATTISGGDTPELVERVLEVIDRQLGRHYPWPGNVRELAQCIRRVMLKRSYEGHRAERAGAMGSLIEGIETGSLTADELLGRYCRLLYDRCGTYEEVARQTGLDRRTVKKRVDETKK